MQSGVRRVSLKPLDNRVVYLCGECDALWDTPDRSKVENGTKWVDFSEYMEARGLEGMWHHVTILDDVKT